MTRSLAGIVVALGAAVAVAQVPRPLANPPVTVEFDTCLLPDPACPADGDRLTLLVRGRTQLATLHVLRVVTSTQPRGTVRVLLTERPLRVYGPAAVLAPLIPGARLHVRAALRLHTRDLLLQAVRPLDGAAREGSRE